jgi:hypothetical protein
MHISLMTADGTGIIGTRHWDLVPSAGDFVCLSVGGEGLPFRVSRVMWGCTPEARAHGARDAAVIIELEVPPGMLSEDRSDY